MPRRQSFVQTDSSQWLRLQDGPRTHLAPTKVGAGGNGAAGAASVANWQSPDVDELLLFDPGMSTDCEHHLCSAPHAQFRAQAQALVRNVPPSKSTPPELGRAPLPLAPAPTPALTLALRPAVTSTLAGNPAGAGAAALALAPGADLLPAQGPTCGQPASPSLPTARSSRANVQVLR